MNRLKSKVQNSSRRSNRVRTIVKGTSDRPRLSVNVSNRHLSAQIIDDTKQKTLVYVSTTGKISSKGTMTDQAKVVGQELAKQAKAKKITQVAFDRGSRLYHGRIKVIADSAREEGLKF
jgi:large subunit ribosomal protein L18